MTKEKKHINFRGNEHLILRNEQNKNERVVITDKAKENTSTALVPSSSSTMLAFIRVAEKGWIREKHAVEQRIFSSNWFVGNILKMQVQMLLHGEN